MAQKVSAEFGPYIRAARLAAGYAKVAPLARRIGITSSFLGRVEDGIGNPSPRTVMNLIRVLGLDPEEARQKTGWPTLGDFPRSEPSADDPVHAVRDALHPTHWS